MIASSYTIADVQTDVAHIETVLDLAIDIIIGIETASVRDNNDRERTAALLWMCRDTANKVVNQIDLNYQLFRVTDPGETHRQ